MEEDFPACLTYNKETGKTCFIVTCLQIGSTLVRPGVGLEVKFWTRFIHLLVSIFLKITGAKYCQEYLPDFTTVEESVFTTLNSKEGAFNHMELLCKFGLLSNMVIFKVPCQMGGVNSHATDPGKADRSHWIMLENRDSMPTLELERVSKAGKASNATNPGNADGSHWIAKENRDSMPTADRAKKAGEASLGKPKGEISEWYVTVEVDPLTNLPLKEKGARFANTKAKAAARLVSEGVGSSYSTCCNNYMTSWFKEANNNKSKTTFIQGKQKATDRLWKLIIVAEEPEGITAVDDEMFKEVSESSRKKKLH
jgi:hypothetical protein